MLQSSYQKATTTTSSLARALSIPLLYNLVRTFASEPVTPLLTPLPRRLGISRPTTLSQQSCNPVLVGIRSATAPFSQERKGGLALMMSCPFETTHCFLPQGSHTSLFSWSTNLPAKPRAVFHS